MPPTNILAIAQRQALDIHLSIALMNRPHEIWSKVDDLLQTLTGMPELSEGVSFKKTTPPATLILSLLDKHRDPLTLNHICKGTELEPESAQQAIDELLCAQSIYSPKKRGWKTYALVK